MNITISDLVKLNNPKIIDIRNIENYNNNHIPTAINIPYNNLLINPNKYLNKRDIYYIYCKKGNTSKTVCQFLNRQGFNVYNILGGYEAWILEN